MLKQVIQHIFFNKKEIDHEAIFKSQESLAAAEVKLNKATHKLRVFNKNHPESQFSALANNAMREASSPDQEISLKDRVKLLKEFDTLAERLARLETDLYKNKTLTSKALANHKKMTSTPNFKPKEADLSSLPSLQRKKLVKIYTKFEMGDFCPNP